VDLSNQGAYDRPMTLTHETADSISFLCLHLLVNEPECVDMAREIPQAVMYQSSTRVSRSWTYIVRQMLMSKSQLHPVTIAAAAGGSKIAT